MEIVLKYRNEYGPSTNEEHQAEMLEHLTTCWNHPFTAEHPIFIDEEELAKKESAYKELTYRTEEYNRINKILRTFYKNLRKHKKLNKDDAFDMTRRLFMFYCLYAPDVRYYNNLITGVGGVRLSDFEKQRKAVKSALSNCKSIRFICRNDEVRECSVCRLTSGKWVKMNNLERDVFVGLIRADKKIGNIINLREGDIYYSSLNKRVWTTLNKLALSALAKTKPTFAVYSGSERASHTKHLASNLKPLYKFIIKERLSNISIIAYPSEFILNLLDIPADKDLLERHITRNT